MKKILIILSFFVVNISFSQKQQEIIVNLNGLKNNITLTQNNHSDFSAIIELNEIKFTNKNTDNGKFSEVFVDGFSRPNNIGKAAIPVYSSLIEVPQNADIQVEILNCDTNYYNLDSLGIYKIMPTQKSYSKSTDSKDIVFSFDQNYYNNNSMENTPLIVSEFLGTQRGVGIGRIEIKPFHYNPVTNILKVYNNLEFKIIFDNADINLTNNLKSKYNSSLFNFNKFLLNYSPVSQTKDAFSNYSAPLKYVIVANEYFKTTLEPFVNWKREQGYNVIEFYPASGTSAINNNYIKSYLQNLYESATASDPAPLYLLIIGDHNGNYCIPAFSSKETTYDNDHVTDLYFCTFDGNSDYLPDMYYGRISANTTTELQNALNKIIPYERYSFGDGSYLNNAIMIAGDDSNYGKTHADAAVHYITNNYLNYEHNFENIYAYYNWSGANANNSPYYIMNSASSTAENSINNQISAGVGFANYTAHCSYNGWYDPSITISSINSWTNNNKYSFMIGNCCQSYEFNNSTDAFGEQVLYAQNKGAVNYIGASNYSYWDEDVYWGVGLTSISLTQTNAANHSYQNTGLGAYDRLWHENLENYDDWYYTGGQIIFAGNTAVESSTSPLKKYYWEIYHNSGDPSIIPYLTEPPQLSLNFSTPMQGSTSLVVTTEPYTYVAISTNSSLLDAKWTGSNNSVVLNFPPLNEDAINIVGTKQNRQPSINENIIPLPPLPPLANFIGNPTSITEGETVAFTNLSQYAVNFLWDFGDGETSNEENPIHNYANIGSYNVSLNISNSIGTDSITKIAYITVTPNLNPPIADFSFETTESCNGIIEFTNNSSNFSSLEWNFGDGETSNEENPIHHFSQNGVFYVSLIATNSNGSNTFVSPIAITINMPPAPIANNASACIGDTIYLSANASGTINWYDQNENLFFTGTNYNYTGDSSYVFYLENFVIENQNNYNVGPSDRNFGANSIFNNTTYLHGLYFNVETDLILNSVKMYAQQQVTRTINLFDAESNLINTATVTIPYSSSGSIVNLDFFIPAGNGYLLAIGPCSENLRLTRNTSGANFPYKIDNVISIYDNTTAITGSYDAQYYYFFYDWSVTTIKECYSPRSEIIATINHAPQININNQNPSNFLCETENAILEANLSNNDNAIIYWNGNDPTNIIEETNTATIDTAGVYYFTAINDCGESIDSITFFAGENAEIINIYSVPCSNANNSDGQAFVEIAENNIEDFYFLWSNGENSQNIENLSTGTYYITITSNFGNCETIDSVFVDFLTNNIIEKQNNIFIYPNPANKEIFISNNNTEIIKYELYSIDEKLIYTTNENYFNIENLSVGSYFIKVIGKNEIKILRFIKK